MSTGVSASRGRTDLPNDDARAGTVVGVGVDDPAVAGLVVPRPPAHAANENTAAPNALATTRVRRRGIGRMVRRARSATGNVSHRTGAGAPRRRGERAVTVEFGLFNSACVLPQFNGDEHRRIMDEVAIVQAAERAGFKYTWATEHHFLTEYSHLSANEVFLEGTEPTETAEPKADGAGTGGVDAGDGEGGGSP